MEKQGIDENIHPPSYSNEIPPSSTLIKPQAREPYDASVSFEEYTYFAEKTRAEQELLEPPVLNVRQFFRKSSDNDALNQSVTTHLTEEDFTDRTKRLAISDEEWTNASRAFRSASWGACEFYLCCCDRGPMG
jgi:hypothetical protein